MQLAWLAVLGCVCVLASPAHSAPSAVSTQDTLVVARSEDTVTESVKESVSEAATELTSEAATTDEPVLPIKLTEMEVISEVSLRYAHTVVVARVRNPAKRAQEANFRVLLPETAFISGFVMTLDGKSYKAYVKEKEEAKQIYEQAVSQGFGAAHVTAKARDSNQFVVSVNVEPSSSAVFNLTYEELLVRRNSVYNHAINLHPGALVPKLSVTVHLKEAQKITELRVPEVRTGNEVDATKNDAQNSKAVITRGHDDREATITFSPDLEEQKRLMQVYVDKSKESAANTHTYRWNQPDEDSESDDSKGVLGQFVVQYDVERPKDGEILVNDGYFVHFFAPTDLPPLNKYAVFVLDTSGSMMDRKIVQLREAMQTILSDLNPGDYFSIVEFASSVTVHALKEADLEPPKHQNYYWGEAEKKATLLAPSPATPENIDKAKVIISRLSASGGTNIDSALDVAVNLIHKRTEWGKRKPKNNETEAAEGTTEVTPNDSTNSELYNAEKMKNLEPIIIFLTDGDPTVGVTNPTTIINRLTEKNTGREKATIFSLAFGEDADRKFLRKLSLRNDGFMRHIYEAADAALQLQDFYRQVSSPLLADVKFIYPNSQVKEGTITKNQFRTFYSGSEVVVAGQIAESVHELTPQISGFCGNSDGSGKKRYEKLPKVTFSEKGPSPVLPLERLWSYLTIKQLLDEKDATDVDSADHKQDTPEKKALALALKYSFVTPLTSLVVVKPNATNAVNTESVDKPNYLPSYSPLGQTISLPPASAAGFPAASFAGYGALPGQPSPVYASQALFLDRVENEFEEEAYENDFDQDIQGFSNRVHYLNAPVHRIAGSSASGSRWSSSSLGHGYSGFNSGSHSYPSGSSGLNSWGSSHISSSGYYPTSLSTRPSLYSTLIVSGTTDSAISTPALTTVRPVLSTTSTDLITKYRLQEFRWTLPLLNATADALVMEVNGTNVDLKLTKDSDVPKTVGGDASCSAAVDGGAGVCVYLTRCEAAKQISVDTYKTSYCSVNDGYAGVCCSSKNVDLITVR